MSTKPEEETSLLNPDISPSQRAGRSIPISIVHKLARSIVSCWRKSLEIPRLS